MQYAVTYMSLFDHNMETQIVEADDWKEAFNAALPEVFLEAEDLEDAKDEAFNQDWVFEVVPVPVSNEYKELIHRMEIITRGKEAKWGGWNWPQIHADLVKLANRHEVELCSE